MNQYLVKIKTSLSGAEINLSVEAQNKEEAKQKVLQVCSDAKIISVKLED